MTAKKVRVKFQAGGGHVYSHWNDDIVRGFGRFEFADYVYESSLVMLLRSKAVTIINAPNHDRRYVSNCAVGKFE
jgi:hypothetical protein